MASAGMMIPNARSVRGGHGKPARRSNLERHEADIDANRPWRGSARVAMPWNARVEAGRLALGIPKSGFWPSDPRGIK